MSKQKAVIIFSGFNDRAVIAFLRTLEKNTIPYGIIASSKKDQIYNTKYADKVLAVREFKPIEKPDLTRCIQEVDIVLSASEYIIAPSTEYLNRYLIDNIYFFKEQRCIIPLVEKSIYELVSDKISFCDLCSKHNIKIPIETYNLDGINYPFVAKPKKYFASDGSTPTPVIINNKEELSQFESDYQAGDFYYQQYISGDSYYLLYYFDKNQNCAKSSQVNYLQQPGGKSMIASSLSNIHTEHISDEYENLFKDIEFRGLVMVEIKQYKNEYYMIEANPRFWGPSQLFVDANINLFEDFLHDWGLLDNKPKHSSVKVAQKYFWFGGLVQTLMKGDKPIKINPDIKSPVAKNLEDWVRADIYNREDTMKIFNKEIGII